MENYTLEPITESKGYELEPVEASTGVGDTLYMVASTAGHIGRAAYETASSLFSGLYAWPASKVAGVTTLLLSGDHAAAKAVEEGVANELTVKPQTEEAQYITGQVARLIDIPMSLLGEVARTGVQMTFDMPAPFHPQTLTRDEAAYIAEPVFQIGAMPALMKIAKMGVGSFGELGRELPQFLKEMTGRGVSRETAKPAPGIAKEPPAPAADLPPAEPSAVRSGEVSPMGEIGAPAPGEAIIGSERGSFSAPVEEKPLLHKFPKKIEERWQAAIPADPTLFELGKERITDLYNKVSRVYEELPNTAEWAPLKFELLNLQKYRGIASDKATRGLEEIVKGFDKPLMDLFERKVILDDLFYTAERDMRLPYGFTKESLAMEKIILDDLVGKHPRVTAALATRKNRWEEMRTAYVDAMEEIGFNVGERFQNPDYYHHQVLEYAQAKNIVRGAGQQLRTPDNRGFLQKRVSTDKDINRDYLRVEHDVQAQMIHDIKIAQVIKLVDERHNIAEQIQLEARAAGVPWKQYIPDGWGLWQPREGNVFYMTQAIPSQIANALMSGALEQFGITAEMLKPVLAVGGLRREFVLKKELINTLDKLVKDQRENVVSAASSWLMRQWKEKIALINPRGFFKYNARNLSGDAEAVFIGNPNTFSKSKQSFQELYNVFFGDGKMTPDLNRFFEMGGFEGTMQAIEMKSFGDIKAFEHLYAKDKGLLDIPGMAWDKYWKTSRLATDLREGVLRYASYLDYLEQMKKSPDGLPRNYGASIPEEIRALGDIERRAYWLQDDLLGAYDKVGIIGQDLRRHIWPFWSWKETNAKRYIQLWKNATDSGELASSVGRALGAKAPMLAWRVGKFAIKASALLAIVEVYNQTFFKEEEDLLPENVKQTAHIIFGRDSEGKVVYFDRLGIFQDFLSNFGLDQSGKLAKDVMNGKMTIKAAAVSMLKGPLNVAAQGVSPWFKIPAELISGRTFFPDATKPGTIRDRKLYFAQQLKLGDEYKAIFGLPSEGYAKSLKKMLVYTSDPGQAAYSDIMEEKRRFAERMGKEGEGFFITPKGNSLFNYKLALRYKDYKAAEHYLDEYVAKGGTGAGLTRSLQAMNPLYGMNPTDRMQFLAGLNDESMTKLERAMDYYLTVLSQDEKAPPADAAPAPEIPEKKAFSRAEKPNAEGRNASGAPVMLGQ
jgi:hypothetical protein